MNKLYLDAIAEGHRLRAERQKAVQEARKRAEAEFEE